MLRIGIDFDNTIVDYRPVFASAATGIVGGKIDVRDALRAQAGGEEKWQELQAHVYGVAIAEAPAFEGFEVFVATARERGAELYIVSHKSQFAAARPEGPDLREAARTWLHARKISVDGVYFEDTRQAKVSRIASLGLSHFIDDLEEVLRDPGFPASTRAICFRDSWDEVRRDVLG